MCIIVFVHDWEQGLNFRFAGDYRYVTFTSTAPKLLYLFATWTPVGRRPVERERGVMVSTTDSPSRGSPHSDSDATGSHSEWERRSDDLGAQDSTTDAAGSDNIDGGRQRRLRGARGRATNALPSAEVMERGCKQQLPARGSRGAAMEV